MTYPFMKWSFFTLLFLLAPALLFLVMAIYVCPPIFFVAGILFMLAKPLMGGGTSDTASILALFGVHLLIYAALYYGIAVLAAKAITRWATEGGRQKAFALTCLAFVLLTLLPVYGAGGHSAGTWGALPVVLGEINESYGPFSVAGIYGAAILLYGVLWFKARRRT